MDIQDFGEKIGGARKDLWKERGLSVDDLSYMNDAEKTKLVKKDNIWKKPNYQEMVKNGLPIRVVYFIKTIRDATPTQANFLTYHPSKEDIEERLENYITFVSEIRDAVMNLSTEDDILNFYNRVMSKYIIRNPNEYYIQIIPSASGFIDNKFLRVSNVKNFATIDSEIRKKQFCYTDEQKVLSNFEILLYDNDNTKFTKDYSNRTVIEVKERYGKRFIYPKEGLSDLSNWKENTIFIIIRETGKIVKNNLENIEAAEKYILENYKHQSNEKTNNSKDRKKKFIPKQLKNISRDGENYRNNKDINGEDMINTFNFKGGEFGNWLNENDRQQCLNYGYDALLDLSKALSISPADIALGGKLSIAFGSRGSGNALAHYEPDREVINLTKLKGAGSLAHEWGHALDDVVGKQLGLSGFITEHYRYLDSSSKFIKDIIETMKYKIASGPKIVEKQVKEYEKQVNRITNLINSFFPKEHLTEEQIKKKDILIQKIIDDAEKSSENLALYLSSGNGNKEVDELSNLRKQIVGRTISKNDRLQIIYSQNNVANRRKQIGKTEEVKTDFYKNSIRFDETYTKSGHGYWTDVKEMFARSFACYVSDKLNNRSDYLCGHAELALGLIPNKDNELELIKVFPEGEERQLINEKIDNFINFLKEKSILHDCRIQQVDNNLEYDYDY